MNIHQFSVTYQPEEDRILMRVNALEGEELALWLTRRLVLRLWPVLVGMQKERLLRQDASAVVAGAPASLQDMVAAYQKEKVLRDQDFSTPYRDGGSPSSMRSPRSADAGTQPPAGALPLLVTHVQAGQEPTGLIHLRFDERLAAAPSERSLQVAVGVNEFHGVMHLLELALDAAQWHGGASASTPDGTEHAGPADGQAARVLN